MISVRDKIRTSSWVSTGKLVWDSMWCSSEILVWDSEVGLHGELDSMVGSVYNSVKHSVNNCAFN